MGRFKYFWVNETAEMGGFSHARTYLMPVSPFHHCDLVRKAEFRIHLVEHRDENGFCWLKARARVEPMHRLVRLPYDATLPILTQDWFSEMCGLHPIEAQLNLERVDPEQRKGV